MKQLIILLLFVGCTVTKDKQSKIASTNEVAKVDSGAVKSNSNFNENKWTKETIYFKEGKDTTINNYFTSPVKIIREAGTQTSKQSNYDSSWNKKLDSLAAKLEESNKRKSEEALSFWQLLGLGIAIAIVTGVVIVVLMKFKIVGR